MVQVSGRSLILDAAACAPLLLLWLGFRESVDRDGLPNLLDEEWIGLDEALAFLAGGLDHEAGANHSDSICRQHGNDGDLVDETIVVGRRSCQLVGSMFLEAAHAVESAFAWTAIRTFHNAIGFTVDTVDDKEILVGSCHGED